mgnify:CR=1 FL=1
MRFSLFGYILITLMFLILIKIYKDSDYSNLKCIISGVDNKRYCVRERSKLVLAANLLAKITTKMQKLVNFLIKKYPEHDNIKRLHKKFNPNKITETLPTSEYTAYSLNKGQKISFCLDTERENGILIDENTLMFVALHELSHVCSISTGHTDEFWENFKFLIEEALELGIYKPVDYSEKPQRYCGMNIIDNPYYND